MNIDTTETDLSELDAVVRDSNTEGGEAVSNSSESSSPPGAPLSDAMTDGDDIPSPPTWVRQTSI